MDRRDHRRPARDAPAREANPALVDLVTGACQAAGFSPEVVPATDEPDMLATIAAGRPTWTVYYAAQAELYAGTALAFREPQPPLLMPTMLAVAAGRDHDALIAACRAVA